MMITPHGYSMRSDFILGCVLFGLLTSGVITPASAQVGLTILDPPPGSPLTTSSVTFTGGHGGQTGEQHWAYVGDSPGSLEYSHGAPDANHQFTASGLPATGTIYVRYFSRPTNTSSWESTISSYTMNVGSGGPRVWNCPAGDVDCLINAITIGNGSGNPEVIQLAAGTYTLDSLDNGQNLLPRIIGDITIKGAGTISTIIRSTIRISDRSPELLQTFDVDEIGILELASLSIIWGGTGIHNSGTVTMREVTISDNRMIDNKAVGTGIHNEATGTMTIQNSTISDYGQTFPSGGGGILNFGTIDMTGSTIRGNSSSGGAAGIFNSRTGILTITASTIANNIGQDSGRGAIVNRGQMELMNSLVQNNSGFIGGLESFGQASISRSIFTGNRSEFGVSGGAIFNSGPMTISQTVIALNMADDGGGIFNFGDDLSLDQTVILGNEAASDGGGIKNVNNGHLTLTETVITNNTPDDCVGCP